MKVGSPTFIKPESTMTDNRSRQFVQASLDALVPYLFKGADVMITLAAVMAFPEGFPKILVSIASQCPEEERKLLMFRSGSCVPFSRHAGQKQKANEEAKLLPSKPAIKVPITPVGHHNGLQKEVLSVLLLARTAHTALTATQIAEKLGTRPKLVGLALHRLIASKKHSILRTALRNTGRNGPKFSYAAVVV